MTAPISRTPRRRRAALALLPLAVVTLAAVLAGCGSGGGGSTAASSSGGAPAPARAAGVSGAAEPAADTGATTDKGGSPTNVDPVVAQRSVVSTGEVSLTSKNVAGVRARVDALLTRYHGFLAAEQTETDRKGRQTSASLTLRIPSARFDTAMHDLAGLGRLNSADRSADDVTTQVIDVQQQIHAQEVGLRRLEQLMRKSASLPNLLAVEREVTSRQAQLDSLKARAAYLSDQTSLSTITLTVSRRPPPAPPVKHTGFLGGLEHGWHALVATTRATLAAVGAALPFAVVLLVLWLPLRRWLRKAPRPGLQR